MGSLPGSAAPRGRVRAAERAVFGRWPLGVTAVVVGLVLACGPAVIPLAFAPRRVASALTASSAVIIDPALAGDPALQVALDRLAGALGQPSPIGVAWSGGEIPDESILILAADSATDRQFNGPQPPAAEDSYRIAAAAFGDRPLTIVEGRGALGPADGVFRLAELIQTAAPALQSGLDLSVSPAFPFRLTGDPLDPNYPDPAEALRRGYNAILIDAWPELALYDRIDPRIYDPGEAPAERAWIKERRARTRARIALAKSLHLQVVTLGDLVTLPRRVHNLDGSAVSPPGDAAVYCWDYPAVRQLVEAGLDEVLTDFPEIDAVLVRTGENYAGGFLSGNPPHRAPGCPEVPDETRLRQVIDLVRGVVVDRHGRVYIHRTWDLGMTTFHGDPNEARIITAGLPADPRLRFSFKQTQTDFWRYNEPNPNLANRRIDRMVELQAAREYEGKGAFPDYLGGLVAGGTPETRTSGSLASIAAEGVRSVWVWPKGGGWGGPILADDLWVDANRYALDHLIWEPHRSARELAQEWAAPRFGGAAAPAIASLLERSPRVILEALYPRAAGQASDGWLPNQNWVRDDLIASASAVRPLYEAAQRVGAFDSTLADSAAARAEVDAWRRSLQVPASESVGNPNWQAALASLRYESTLFATLDSYLSGLFYYFRWQDGGRRNDADRRQAADRLRQALAEWQIHQDTARADGFATPFQDGGMRVSIAAVFREMGGPQAADGP